MKKLPILLIFLFTVQFSFSQKDTVLVKTIYDNIYENFSNTGKKNVLKQITYDLKQKKLREVYYKNNKIDYYTYFFYYPNDSIKQIQYYNNSDSIIKYTNFLYKRNKLKMERTYSASNNMNNIIDFKKYKIKNNELTIKYYNSNKKLISQTHKEFNKNHIVKLTFEDFTNDTLKKDIIIYKYDSTNQITGLIQTKQLSDNVIDTVVCKYYYIQKLSLPLKKEFLNSNNKLLYTEEYAYYPEGNLKWKIILNPKGKWIYFEDYDLKKYYREIPKKELIIRKEK